MRKLSFYHCWAVRSGCYRGWLIVWWVIRFCVCLQTTAFSQPRSRTQAFIFHRWPATLAPYLTWVDSSLPHPPQMTAWQPIKHIITLDRCDRVCHRAVLGQEVVGRVQDPSHWFCLQPVMSSTRLLLCYFQRIVLQFFGYWEAKAAFT